MKYNRSTLKNGIRLITVPMPDNPAVTILVMVEAGSKYERKDENGISHFLEHMVFKGTTRRPKAIEISKELDSIGSHYNAFTSQEFTGYYAKAASKHFDKVLDVVSDMFLNPLLETSEIEKEKGVITEEIRMYKDLPQRMVHDTFLELLYGDQPAGWNIAGTEERVKSFTRDNFVDYRNRLYTTAATTVIVSGSFDVKNVKRKVEKAFVAKKGKKTKKAAVMESQDKPNLKLTYKETDQTHLVIGVRTFPVKDKRNVTLEVLSGILGKGMSSRLFTKMRDQLGICYYVKTEVNAFTDHGYLSISAGVDNSRVKEGIQGILSECKRLIDEEVGTDELQKVKDYLSGTTMLELETSDARAEFFGFQEVMKNKIEKPDEIIKKIKKVTAKDVRKMAKEIFTDKNLNMAIIGKFNDPKVFEDYFKFNS